MWISMIYAVDKCRRRYSSKRIPSASIPFLICFKRTKLALFIIKLIYQASYQELLFAIDRYLTSPFAGIFCNDPRLRCPLHLLNSFNH